MNVNRTPFAEYVPWFRYMLPEGRQILLTQRPDVVLAEPLDAWLKAENPCARFCFCDDWVRPPQRGPEWHWYPWPLKRLAPENVFAMLSIMEDIKTRHHICRPVWFHCDSSTMRAPTNFGCFLLANYDRETAEQIVANVQYSPDREPGMKLYENPLEYAEICFGMDKGIKPLVAAWRKGGAEAAHAKMMGRPRWRKTK